MRANILRFYGSSRVLRLHWLFVGPVLWWCAFECLWCVGCVAGVSLWEALRALVAVSATGLWALVRGWLVSRFACFCVLWPCVRAGCAPRVRALRCVGFSIVWSLRVAVWLRALLARWVADCPPLRPVGVRLAGCRLGSAGASKPLLGVCVFARFVWVPLGVSWWVGRWRRSSARHCARRCSFYEKTHEHTLD